MGPLATENALVANSERDHNKAAGKNRPFPLRLVAVTGRQRQATERLSWRRLLASSLTGEIVAVAEVERFRRAGSP
jgi:hypothetical protein